MGITIGERTHSRRAVGSSDGEVAKIIIEEGSNAGRHTQSSRGAAVAGSTSRLGSTRHVQTIPKSEPIKLEGGTLILVVGRFMRSGAS